MEGGLGSVWTGAICHKTRPLSIIQETSEIASHICQNAFQNHSSVPEIIIKGPIDQV